MRFEIKPSIWYLHTVMQALRKAGAKRVNARHYGGMSNQAQTATFQADNHADAVRICEVARQHLSNTDMLPELIPFVYGPGFVWARQGNVSRLVKGDQHA